MKLSQQQIHPISYSTGAALSHSAYAVDPYKEDVLLTLLTVLRLLMGGHCGLSGYIWVNAGYRL